MPKRLRLIAGLLVMLAGMLAWGYGYAAGDPSMHQVYQAAQAGRMGEAQAMMDQVLRDHPNSAKAHYVEAQLLAKQGRSSVASSELATAERLAPGLPFAKASAVQELQQEIASPGARRISRGHAAQYGLSSGFSLGMILLGIALITALVYFARSLMQRNQAVMTAGGAAPGSGNVVTAYGAPGFAGPIGPAAGSGIGSRIAGGLATGAALGAGMVAGEALMRHFTGGGSAVPGGGMMAPTTSDWDTGANDDMGGSDFGMSDDSSWDDSTTDMGDDWN